MEAWLVPVIAAVTGFFTWLATKTQMKHAERRFNKELERERERENRLRRQQVRSEPLLRFRDQLASLAAYMDLHVRAIQVKQLLGTRSETTDKFIQQATNEGNFYVEVKNFQHALFRLDDTEVRKKAQEALDKYEKAHEAGWTKLPPEEFAKKTKLLHEAQEAIREAQSLVNQRLEEL